MKEIEFVETKYRTDLKNKEWNPHFALPFYFK